ncbi:histidine-specific methyltransferase [Phyllosticta citribraziliensis]|uniref:Histidine-specific methyltransferase n=1 Tax=Phyllosticta citribraziliensis TaxID=989973 RepID=A0ABR1LUA5_9PEZI
MAQDILLENGSGGGTRNGDARADSPQKNGSSNIINIRGDANGNCLLDDALKGLHAKEGTEKTLSTILLYDEVGLRLFEKITYLKDYYLTNAEIEVLETYAERIADRIQPGSILLELGSGNLRKVNIILQALERQGKDVDYYALDLDVAELQRTLAEVPSQSFKHVKCFGLHATYDDGLEWLKRPEIASRPKTVLWMGSSIGNFKREECPGFLRSVAGSLQEGDTLLIGIDSCLEPKKVHRAYNDSEGVTHQFYLNGLEHANRLLGTQAFKPGEWKVVGEFDSLNGRHQAFVVPLKDVVVDDVLIKAGEKVRIEESYKFSPGDIRRLFDDANLAQGARWMNQKGDYGLYLVSKPQVFYSLHPKDYAAEPAPTLSDWKQLWAAWDAVGLNMLPQEGLLEKPIKLRNACIFYLGHIPTFLDMHLTRSTREAATEPAAQFASIFERGIDPDVDNPELCHAHSEIPEAYPPVEQILRYQSRVRGRVAGLYGRGMAQSDARVARSLWLGYEHEMMHLETLLYMLVQSDQPRTRPPPGVVAPDFEALAREARSRAVGVENQWFKIPAATLDEGLDDPENESGPRRFFGWDNEKPRRRIVVGAFEAKARAITVADYAKYLDQTASTQIPASWARGASRSTSSPRAPNNGALTDYEGITVRTVFGPVPLAHALDWPVLASYDELAGCARWMDGRIPTADEARSIYAYVERVKKSAALKDAVQCTIPAVNGHLVNDGVAESPPSHRNGNHTNGVSCSNGDSNSNGDAHAPASLAPEPNVDLDEQRRALFADLSHGDDHDDDTDGINIGFKHWHPTAVTARGHRLAGQGDMGGAWEWTSTALAAHAGFAASAAYPGYTADFFDGKHNVVLGGSWATHPRIAGRRSFVNWYQRNYPYVWATARVVRDI